MQAAIFKSFEMILCKSVNLSKKKRTKKTKKKKTYSENEHKSGAVHRKTRSSSKEVGKKVYSPSGDHEKDKEKGETKEEKEEEEEKSIFEGTSPTNENELDRFISILDDDEFFVISNPLVLIISTGAYNDSDEGWPRLEGENPFSFFISFARATKRA